MGSFYYGDVQILIQIEDCVFVYFKVVIVMKLCWNESFMLLWWYFDGDVFGCFMLWLYLLILLCFVFQELEMFELSCWWIEEFVYFVNLSGGIIFVEEYFEVFVE